MPILPSSSTITIEPDGRGALAMRSLVIREDGTGNYELAIGGDAALEIVETSPGTFEAVPVGTSPTARRLVNRQVGGDRIILY